MKKVIRFFDKATNIVAVPFFSWMVIGQILRLFHKLPLSPDGSLSPDGWFINIGVIFIILFVVVAFPWLFLRAMAYEDKE